MTSGYIVSPGLKDTDKTPHFDVIIYDQLESPILWVEDNPDASSQGQSLAIPAEYVGAVLEVKSRFTPSTVEDAMGHLRDLLPIMGLDASDEQYKLYLPRRFVCGIVFFELRTDCLFSESALAKTMSGIELRNFMGGLILRGEGHPEAQAAGRISLLRSETPIESSIGRDKQSLLGGAAMCQSVKVTDHFYLSSMLMWLETEFSRFAFDLIAVLNGKYEDGRVSSWYGMGTSRSDLTKS